MRLYFGLLLLLVSPVVFAAETKISVDLAGDATQQKTAPPGSVFLELSPLKPGATYQISDLPDLTVDDVPADADATADLCTDPAKRIWGQIGTATSETDVANAIEAARINAASCTFAQKETINGAIQTIGAKLTTTVALKGKVTPPITVDIKRDNEAWKVFVVLGPSSNPDLLNEIEKRMDADTRTTVTECSYLHGRCEASPLFVNADHVSAIIFRGIPTGKRVRVVADPMSAPFEGCEVLRQNSKTFERADTPDVIVVTMNMFRPLLGGWVPRSKANRRAAALRLYGWSDLPEKLTDRQIEALCKTSDLTAGIDDNRSANAEMTGKPVDIQRIAIRDKGYQIEEMTAIPIVVDGKTEQVKVTMFVEGEPPKTFVVPFLYQRWWVDAGGAFLFPYVKNERLVTETQSDGKLKVIDIEQSAETKPETGIVVNLHPGNFPDLGLQFGLSTGESAQLTYYLGPAIRLREIGKRGLASFSVGAALAPTQNFPDVHKGTIYEGTDARLKGGTGYELHWYAGISLGFNFGGVVSGADAVKELP